MGPVRHVQLSVAQRHRLCSGLRERAIGPIESPLRPCAPPLDGSEPLVLTAATRLAAVALVAAAALEQLAASPVPTDREPIGIEVGIDGLAVVIVLTLGLSCSAYLHKSIRLTRSARGVGQSNIEVAGVLDSALTGLATRELQVAWSRYRWRG